MVLLRRLSRWCALCDLQILLGCSKYGLSRVFRFMLTMVNRRYGKLVSNVKIWSEHFPAFAKHLRGMGFPIDNGVLFVDGTLKDVRLHPWAPNCGPSRQQLGSLSAVPFTPT